jgi:hypothetical protein
VGSIISRRRRFVPRDIHVLYSQADESQAKVSDIRLKPAILLSFFVARPKPCPFKTIYETSSIHGKLEGCVDDINLIGEKAS